MNKLCKILLPLLAFFLPLSFATAAGASLHSPCHAYSLGPTFAPNGGVAYCDGGGAYVGNHLRVKVRCSGDAPGSYRYGPAVYNDNQSSALYCPNGRTVEQVGLALYA